MERRHFISIFSILLIIGVITTSAYEDDYEGLDGLEGDPDDTGLAETGGEGEEGGGEEEEGLEDPYGYDEYDDPYLSDMMMAEHYMDGMRETPEDRERLERMEMMEKYTGKKYYGGIGVREYRRQKKLKSLRRHLRLPQSLNATFPGTKWCGPGNTAENYDDLGLENDTDSCCRDHDHCQNTIPPAQCKNGICNNSTFTMSHCDCDHNFRKCLTNARSPVGDRIGYIYFNLIQMKCFKYEHPIKKCRKYGGPRHNQCELYELEESRTEQWQSFDLPRFEGLPPLPDPPPPKPSKKKRRRPNPYGMGYPGF